MHTEHFPLGHARVVAIEARAAHGDQLAVGERLEEVGTGRIDQPHTPTHELERPGVRVAACLALRDVHHHTHTRLDELFRGDAVEVGVVDDRDVVGPDALGQVLRAAIEPGVPGELHETHAGSLGSSA